MGTLLYLRGNEEHVARMAAEEARQAARRTSHWWAVVERERERARRRRLIKWAAWSFAVGVVVGALTFGAMLP